MRKAPLLCALCLSALSMTLPVAAADGLEYSLNGPSVGTFATPTSDNTVYVDFTPAPNTDRSKNAALIPPAFGSNTANLLGSGTPLTPNLVGGSAVVNGNSGGSGATILPPTNPAAPTNGNSTGNTNPSQDIQQYTAVTKELYYAAGHVGSLKIPAIDLSVNVYEGTTSAPLLKGAGHFSETSIWGGNVAIAGHNRGVNNHFGKLHTLKKGDVITYTTKLGTQKYEVYSVEKISVNNTAILNPTSRDILTLVTCVMNQGDARWCVQARAIK